MSIKGKQTQKLRKRGIPVNKQIKIELAAKEYIKAKNSIDVITIFEKYNLYPLSFQENRYFKKLIKEENK